MEMHGSNQAVHITHYMADTSIITIDKVMIDSEEYIMQDTDRITMYINYSCEDEALAITANSNNELVFDPAEFAEVPAGSYGFIIVAHTGGQIWTPSAGIITLKAGGSNES